ncbi:MAG: ABC transporter permease [Burkholderiaceae bacterium]
MIDPRTPFGATLLALTVLGFAYLLLPILVVVVAPLGDTGYLAFPPKGLTLRWYQAAIADPRYFASFLNSLWIATVVATISTAAGVPAAYALSRHAFPGARLLEAVFLSPLILPTLVLALGLAIWFARIGFTAGTPRLIAAHLVVCIPYVIRICLPVFRRFDRALEEAAANLGARPLAAFMLVMLPAVRPGLVAGATMAFITSFDELVLALFLADPGRPTLPVTIYSAVQLGFEPPVAAVSGLLVLLTTVGMLVAQFAGRRRD